MADIDIHFYDSSSNELPPPNNPNNPGGGNGGTTPPPGPVPAPQNPAPTPAFNWPSTPAATAQNPSGPQPTAATLQIVSRAISQSATSVMQTVIGHDPIMGHAVTAVRGLTQALSLIQNILAAHGAQAPGLPSTGGLFPSSTGSNRNQAAATDSNRPNQVTPIDWGRRFDAATTASRAVQGAESLGSRFVRLQGAGAPYRAATGQSLALSGSRASGAATYASRVSGGAAAFGRGVGASGAITGASSGAGAATAGGGIAALTAAAAAMGVVVVALSAVAIAAASTAAAVTVMKNRILAAAEDVKGFNASIALASARQRVSSVYNRMRRASAVGPEMTRMIELQTQLNRTWSEFGNVVMKIIAPIVEQGGKSLMVMVEIVTEILKFLGPTLEILTNINTFFLEILRGPLNLFVMVLRQLNRILPKWDVPPERVEDKHLRDIERFLGGEINVEKRPDGRMF